MAFVRRVWCWLHLLIISVQSWSTLVPRKRPSFALSSAPTRRDVFQAVSQIIVAHGMMRPVLAVSAVVPTNNMTNIQERALDGAQSDDESEDGGSSDEDGVDSDSDDESDDDE